MKVDPSISDPAVLGGIGRGSVFKLVLDHGCSASILVLVLTFGVTGVMRGVAFDLSMGSSV